MGRGADTRAYAYGTTENEDEDDEADNDVERFRPLKTTRGCRSRPSMLALARPALAAGAAAARRALSVSLPPGASGAAAGVAKELEDKIVARLSGTTKASVTDTSGGCGTMYNIEVESNSFDGLSTVKQHKLVADILKVRSAVPFESCARRTARARRCATSTSLRVDPRSRTHARVVVVCRRSGAGRYQEVARIHDEDEEGAMTTRAARPSSATGRVPIARRSAGRAEGRGGGGTGLTSKEDRLLATCSAHGGSMSSSQSFRVPRTSP